MVWHDQSMAVKMAKKGHPVIISPMSHCYFDFGQFGVYNDSYEYIGGLTTLSRVYQEDPTSGIEKQYWNRILGTQGNLWSEHIYDGPDLEWKAFIRGAALAECGWTELAKKDWNRFFSGLALVEYNRLTLRGVNAAPIALGKEAGWSSGSIPTSWVHMKWNVDGAFEVSGNYSVIFVFAKGKHGLKIKNVELVIGGKSAGIDPHEGLAFDPAKDNIWNISAHGSAKQEAILVEADVCGDGGVDSDGRIYVYHQ
jgi:hypothetical protein